MCSFISRISKTTNYSSKLVTICKHHNIKYTLLYIVLQISWVSSEQPTWGWGAHFLYKTDSVFSPQSLYLHTVSLKLTLNLSQQMEWEEPVEMSMLSLQALYCTNTGVLTCKASEL